MPASKRVLQLVLGLLSIESTPVSCGDLQNSILQVAPELASLIPQALLKLWQRGLILRSSNQINGRYLYFLSNTKQRFSIAGSLEKFVLYSKEMSSKNLKKRILEIIETENIALKLSDIALRLNPKYDKKFLKKIQFHLRSFVESKQISRTGKPYQYYISSRENIVAIDSKKTSLPEQILKLFQERNYALASSEISDIINATTLQAKPAALSLALARLTQSGRLQKSSMRLGARGEIRGHLFANKKTMIDARLAAMGEVKTTKRQW